MIVLGPHVEIKDGNYILADGAAWVELDPFAIRISKTDDGITIDVYKNGSEMDSPIASCWATDEMARADRDTP